MAISITPDWTLWQRILGWYVDRKQRHYRIKTVLSNTEMEIELFDPSRERVPVNMHYVRFD